MIERKKLADAIRVLSMDAVQRANSGHPGAPMGLADIMEVLWNDFLKHNPLDPKWPNRDRFVLSNGHASMLLYSALHLSGYNISIEDIKNFRQLGSITPGHPEYGITPGVETTTGPLGQGLANGVGMAIAEKLLAHKFNRDEFDIVDHYTYVIAGDGCLMEGISHEACSLAGTLGLGKLIVIYDDNKISIDGSTEYWFTEDIGKRFEAYGWHVIRKVDGHNWRNIKEAIEEARREKDRPSLICCQTKIAYGSPNLEGSNKSHGAPLGKDEVEATRQNLNWEYSPFFIPEEIYKAWDAKEKGRQWQQEWEDKFSLYSKKYPELAQEFNRRIEEKLPEDLTGLFKDLLSKIKGEKPSIPTRKVSSLVLERVLPELPELFGGSADLSESNHTICSKSKIITKNNWDGNYLHFGVREFAMAGIMNGMALHGGFIPYGGTFLVFSDYAKSAIRMSALMNLKTIYVFTHDSIGVGEDGPTHQPVEQLTSLRIIPDLTVWRPCDAFEGTVAWKYALEDKGATALVLSRQKLSFLSNNVSEEDVIKGGYVLLDSDKPLDVVIIATGSEVELAIKVAEGLKLKGKKVRVVSMPSLEVFEAQDESYKKSVISPDSKLKVVIEAGVSYMWYKYADKVIGMDRFGKSAPANDVFSYFGFVPEKIEQEIEELLAHK